MFGSLFGHSVTQNLPVLSIQQLNAPENFDSVFNLATGRRRRSSPTCRRAGEFPLPERRLRPRAAREAAAAARRRVQRHRPARADADDVDRGRRTSATAAATCSQATVRKSTSTRRRSSATPACRGTSAGPYFNEFGWTQDVDYFCNCATNAYDSLQAKLTKRFSDGYSVQVNYTLQKAEQDSGEYFQTPLPPAAGLFDTALNRGPADWDRTHNFVFSIVAELPIGRGRDLSLRRLAGDEPPRRRLAVQHQHVHPERAAVQRQLPQLRRGPRHGPESAGSHRRSGGTADARPVVQRDADRRAGQRVRAAGRRERSATCLRNELRGPGYWRVDASIFKHFEFGGRPRRSRCASRR